MVTGAVGAFVVGGFVVTPEGGLVVSSIIIIPGSVVTGAVGAFVVGRFVVTPGGGLVVSSIIIIPGSVVTGAVGAFVVGGIVVTPGGGLVVESSISMTSVVGASEGVAGGGEVESETMGGDVVSTTTMISSEGVEVAEEGGPVVATERKEKDSDGI